MSRAGDRKRLTQFEDFLKKFDIFVAAGLVHSQNKTPETDAKFKRARDDIANARGRLGDAK